MMNGQIFSVSSGWTAKEFPRCDLGKWKEPQFIYPCVENETLDLLQYTSR